MIGTTVSHYRILEHLGGGGMGVVYKAEDVRLGRTVALKFLAPELSRDADSVTRFRNEARAASALDHPGICAIHDIDQTADGRLFIAMAFCAGETLKQRLESGPLPLANALRVARQAADALSQAHARGIVHRDIKPANLILTAGGDVKIVDFGVAKLAGAPAITTTGASIGTPAYMAPEQAGSGVVDARTDLWALGAVLFEMLTGRAPFRGETAAAVVSSILYDEPPPLDSLRPGTPPAVTAIVRRLLAKDRGARYSTAAEASEDLRAAERAMHAAETVVTRSGRPRAVWRHPAAIAAIVAVGAAAIALTLWMRGKTTASGEVSRGRPTDSQALTRIAVLPFENLGSADDEYFAAGITEEITSRLAGVSRLAVPSSTTLGAYDRRGKGVRQIGSDLGVDYLVEGGVRWARGPDGSRVRITPKLIRVADDTTVWTFSYDATLSDVFKVQSDIAYQITGALRVALEARERRALETRPTTDDQAYLLYLRGLTAFQHDTSDTASQSLARTSLEQAVERDPRFAQAWGWLARVYAAQYQTGAARVAGIREKATEAALRALALDPALPEAHLAQATVLLLGRNYEGALRELDAAAVEMPNSPELLRQIGTLERRRGRWRESQAAFERALAIDPASARDLVINYLDLREYGKAARYLHIAKSAGGVSMVVPEAWIAFAAREDVAAARRILEPALGPGEDSRVRGQLARFEWYDGRHERALELIDGMDAAGAWMPANFRFPAAIAAGQVYASMGRHEEARTQYEAAVRQLDEKRRAAPDDYQVEAGLGLAYAGLRRGNEAVQHATRASELLPVGRDAHEGPLYVFLAAQVHAQLGQHDAAFAALDKMFGIPGFYNTTFVKRDPAFVSLRTDPRFPQRLTQWARQKGDVLLK